MTDLEEAKQARDTLTKQLSDIVRQLAFAGIAVIWIVRSEPVKTGIGFDTRLYWPLLLFVVCLTLDLLQYVWAAGVWDTIAMIWSRRKNPDAAMPKWIEYLNAPTRILLWIKAAVLVIGFFVLLLLLGQRLSQKAGGQSWNEAVALIPTANA